MGLLDFLFRRPGRGHDLAELARRLGVSEQELASVPISYTEFHVPKRRGHGRRGLHAPDPALKAIQRRIHRRLLALLITHECCHGFERGRSIVTHASLHQGRAVVVRLDIRDFFNSTHANRIERFFRRIGWNRHAAKRLTELTTTRGGLPQGAPTSPRLANLVNYGLDARLNGLARHFDAAYSRYADDLTFSFDLDEPAIVRALVRGVKQILRDEGYRLHPRKLRILRRHQRQQVTGLVVNEGVALPRKTRRWLRAVEHHLANGGDATLTPAQLDGWRAYRRMIEQPSSHAR